MFIGIIVCERVEINNPSKKLNFNVIIMMFVGIIVCERVEISTP